MFITVDAKQIQFGKGVVTLTYVAKNAVRIQYAEGEVKNDLPNWIYVSTEETDGSDVKVDVDAERQVITVSDKNGRKVFNATAHQLQAATVGGEATHEARLSFVSPDDEFIYGLGQFQDGYTNIRGLMRRLTQVNTQISIPMLISSKGYGLLWNNYGLTDYNPADGSVKLQKGSGVTGREVVDVTSTEGGKREVRERNIYTATLDIKETGDYALLLDVGQKMARRHNLEIDGKNVIEMQNIWLPPTASVIVHLEAGKHELKAELSRGDSPVVYYNKVDDETVLRSPFADAVDYTVFVGNADEVVASYRQLTGEVPMMPQWAMGYIHCRERFHSQKEILETANRFRNEQLPIDVIVQDWQYWGKYGWNSMKFDEAHYPDPKQLTDSLHNMNMRLMVSVWSKIDKRSEVGRQMVADNNYIPGTDWIDFFSDDAARAYWNNFSSRLVPLGIDAWWQDATEPENDDLTGRRVNKGKWSGEQVRNVYPMLVNKTVYEGMLTDRPKQRPMILTRSGFAGIQRYGTALWSGDVGNDWETLRRQISGGLGMQAAGVPWWTYDAGGFFRPGNQYKDKAYIERMLRWVQTSVYLPLMRVHGYQSNTEPWCYGDEAKSIIAKSLEERYRLLPYIYSHAAEVSASGYTLMRPLVFDFSNDTEALQQKYEYMFGSALLISPVTEPGVTEWRTYLPMNAAGWYDYRTGKHYSGGKYVTTPVDKTFIPVFARGGSILPVGASRQFAAQTTAEPLELRIYPGADAQFTLYEDDGVSQSYRHGECSRIAFSWDDDRRTLTIARREGCYSGMQKRITLNVTLPDGTSKSVVYKGKKIVCKFPARAEKTRLIVTTDIGGSDPDDQQSMAHLLTLLDCIDLEGLIYQHVWVANHHPVAVVGNDKTRDVVQVKIKPGNKLRLDASKSTDPDGDSLSYEWIYYKEASSYNGNLDITAIKSVAEIIIPADSKGKDFHIVLRVTDNGTPALTSYRRIIVNC